MNGHVTAGRDSTRDPMELPTLGIPIPRAGHGGTTHPLRAPYPLAYAITRDTEMRLDRSSP